MSKIIESIQENLIECDYCDYVIPNEDPCNPGDGKEYINVPCPKCGNSLLTEKDYLDYQKLSKRIDGINKWFGWMSVIPGFKVKAGQEESATAKVHNGVKIDKK